MADTEEKNISKGKKPTTKKASRKDNKYKEESELIFKEDSPTQDLISSEPLVEERTKEIKIDISSDNPKMDSQYLSSSINLLSFLSDSLGNPNNKIITTIEITLLFAALDKVLKSSSFSLIEKNFNLLFPNNQKDVLILGTIFYSLLSNEEYLVDKNYQSLNFYKFCKKLLTSIDKIKEGESSLNIVLKLLNESEEINSFPRLKKFINSYRPDQFSQLNDIAEKIIALLNEYTLNDSKIHHWRTAVWAFLWVLRYSSQSSEILIDDLLKKKSIQFKDLQIVLIGLFITRLFHYAPSWKPIPLKFQSYKKMKVLQPAAEVLYNPNIITSLSSDPQKQEEYFWIYVWGKPYHIFQKPEIKQVKKFKKKLIEVEEEVIIEEKTFGDFIIVYGEDKPTGFVKLKSNS